VVEFGGYVEEAEAFEGLVGSGEDEDEEADGDEGVVPALDVAEIGHEGVAHGGHHEDDGPEDPADPILDAENEERDDDEAVADLVGGGGDGIEDVAAVELAGGDEVERGDEDSHPACDQDGMGDEQEDGVAGVVEVADESVDAVDEEGRLDAVDEGGGRVTAERETEGDGDEGDEEAGDGTHGSDDDEGGAGADAGFEADDGSEAAAERGSGEQVGKRGADAIGAAGEVVSELVGEEDGDEGEREGQAAGDCGEVVEDPVEGEDVCVGAEGWSAEREVVHVAHADRGGREQGDEEESEGHREPGSGALAHGDCGDRFSDEARRCHRPGVPIRSRESAPGRTTARS
jgi:hypothetical protein